MRTFIPVIWFVVLFYTCSTSFEVSSEDQRRPTTPGFRGEIVDNYNVFDMPIGWPVFLDTTKIAWLTGEREIMIFDINKGKVASRIKGRKPIIGFAYNKQHLFWTESGDKRNMVKYEHATRTELWRVSGVEFASGPMIVGSQCIVAGVNGLITSVSSDSGKEIWSTRIPGRVFTNPVVSDSFLIVPDDNGEISFLDTGTGSVQRRIMLDATPAVSVGIDSSVYVGTFQGDFIKIDASSKSIAWRVNSGNQVRTTPLVTQDFIYWANSAGDLYRIQKITGESRILKTLNTPTGGAPALAEQGILVPGKNEILYLLDITTGEVLRTLEFEGRLRSAPIYVDNRWIIVVEGHWIYALE